MTRQQRSWRTCAVAAAVAAFLAACGGGGGGGGGGFPAMGAVDTPTNGGNPPPAPPPGPPAPGQPPAPPPTEPPAPPPVEPPAPPPSATSSGACLNEADWRAGTTKEEEVKTTQANGTSTTAINTRITGAREPFAGANPVAMLHAAEGVVGNTTFYSDLTGGNHVNYGARSQLQEGYSVETVFDPPLSVPADLQPGQTVDRSYNIVITTVVPDSPPSTDTTSTQVQITYVGRETVQTPLGSIANACKFSTRSTAQNGTVNHSVTWVPADGPYRGQNVRIEYLNADGSMQAVSEWLRMAYTPK